MKLGARFTPLIFAASAVCVICVSYALYRAILRRQSRAYVRGWVQSETASLQQGNVLSSVMKTQRQILDNGPLKGVALVEIPSKKAVIEFGNGVDQSGIDFDLAVFDLDSRQNGLFGNTVATRVSPQYIALFLIEPEYAGSYFFINIASLCILLAGGLLLTIQDARAEQRQREALLSQTIEEFVANLKPSPVLQAQYPSLVNRWIALHSEMENMTAINVELKSQSKIYEQAKQVKHDLGSPLSVLRILSSKMKQTESEFSDLLRSAVERIDGIVRSMELNITTLNDRLQSRIPISHLINRIRNDKLFEIGKDSTPVEIVTTVERIDETRPLNLNHVEIARIVNNLINNSIEASSAPLRISISVRPAPRGIQLTIEDDGPGVPEQVLARLESEGGTFNKLGGTGLGLAHLKQTLMNCGGSYRIQSDNRGTKIEIDIPYAQFATV